MRLPAPRELDDNIGEMWVENIADFEIVGDYNLSMYERNRLFVNGGEGELNALYLVGHPKASPAQVRSALQNAGSTNWDNKDDGDNTKEKLLDVSGF